MKLTFKYIQVVVAGTVAVAATMVGCQDPDYPTPQPTTTGYNTTSTRVLFVNATPDASALNVSVENTSVGQPLSPGNASAYVGIPLGSVAAAAAQIRIKGAGGTLGTNDIISKPALLANTSYTIFATDTINRPQVKSSTGAVTDVGGVRTLQVIDTLTAPAAGTAKIRFFNLAPDVAATSARLVNLAGISPASLTNRAYRTATSTTLRYTSVPAGAYVTQVYSATTVPSALTVTPAASATVTLADGKIYTIYSRGLARTRTLSVSTVQHN